MVRFQEAPLINGYAEDTTHNQTEGDAIGDRGTI
jgi:hypothetical protein